MLTAIQLNGQLCINANKIGNCSFLLELPAEFPPFKLPIFANATIDVALVLSGPSSVSGQIP
jgi:hypothetical protein